MVRGRGIPARVCPSPPAAAELLGLAVDIYRFSTYLGKVRS